MRNYNLVLVKYEKLVREIKVENSVEKLINYINLNYNLEESHIIKFI